MWSRPLLALIGLFATPLASSQVFVDPTALGRITGVVLSEDGQLVDRAGVCVSITTPTLAGSSSAVDCTRCTDHLGKFQIDHVKNGTYTVSAQKPQDGYDGNRMRGQKITVSDADPLHVLTITLGPRGGILSCLVTDKLTGKAIEPDKQNSVERVNFATKAYSMSWPMKGSFRVTVPANTDVTITATAKGYKDWSYRDPSDPTRSALRLAPGERQLLKIEMEPMTKDVRDCGVGSPRRHRYSITSSSTGRTNGRDLRSIPNSSPELSWR